MTHILFSKAAEADLEEIDEYTLEAFGLGQAIKIRARFLEMFNDLARAPLSAPTRAEYDPPGRIFRYCVALRRFIVVYEPAGDGIRVARVLHGARDLASELERESGEK